MLLWADCAARGQTPTGHVLNSTSYRPAVRGEACARPAAPCRRVERVLAYRPALSLALTYAGDAEILIPGPLSSGHSPVGSTCDGCHTGIAAGLVRLAACSGISFLVARSDTKTCLACHKVTPEALTAARSVAGAGGAHQARESDETEAARQMPTDRAWCRARSFPTDAVFADGNMFCATCHKEHQGRTADLSDVSSQRCHACHAVAIRQLRERAPSQFSSISRTRDAPASTSTTPRHFGEHFGKTSRQER